MKSIKEQIREGLTERLRPQLKFEGLRESDVVPLKEHVRIHGNEYAWGSQRLHESEELAEDSEESPLSGDQLKTYRVGDIIMPKELYSPSSDEQVTEHRVLLIEVSDKDQYGIVLFKGFLLSSKATEKANIYQPKRFPNNIWFQDYSSILRKGPKNDHTEGFVNVSDVVEFINEDLDTSGVWKGHVSDAYFHFINECYKNYRDGRSNAYKYWFNQPARSKEEFRNKVKEIRYGKRYSVG